MAVAVAAALTLVLPVPAAGPAAAASVADPSAPGPYAAGYVDTTVSAAGRSFSARITYPATAAGNGQPVAAGRFPAIAFGHGFLQGVSKYASTLSHLSTWGFIVIAPTSQGGFAPDHSAFADDLNAALTWAVTQDTTAGARFAGHVSVDRLGLSGHSMGGGASILAAARNPKVVTVANLAAAETNPSAKAAAATVTVPVQLIAGERDGIAPVADHQRPIYLAKPPAKQLRTIKGGSHCGFMDSGSLFCDSGTISRTTQLQLARRLLTEWFLRHLAGDTSYDDAVWGTSARNDPQVTFEGER
ncbi:alpha/beta hydrolase [Micromonospora sp. PPF5-17]|uniref:Alpha/beta hydrolase n=1 Tax=Micromonospora solifontis TaxID=2487138 RepID=A0ABX9WJS0_9ACTN|nr:alpha/beta hydrolase [Micromonospora sp. PPF5-17B]NES35752.1 alpha/beta hydrolase [Micromonospora solifontis]NES56001.1 alpha/beta hydrolase [Micromonospora sp. PPF5-6]RNM00450.1 alpha/beta hydrolase [Micromonospora solifontis]